MIRNVGNDMIAGAGFANIALSRTANHAMRDAVTDIVKQMSVTASTQTAASSKAGAS